MNVIKKILIVLIIIIFSYIIWRLVAKRNAIIRHMETKKTIENFDLGIYTDPAAAELNGLKDSKITIHVKQIRPEYDKMALKQYCIKGSYNSAFTGNYINMDMLSYLLGRGVRFFDFEVYFIQDATTGLYTPQVGYSTDGKIIAMESTNTILLDNVLSALVAGAFSQTSPNNHDPLFINLRIKSNNNDIYKAVASSVDFTLKPVLYKDSNGGREVTKNTPMSELMGKVVLIVDKTINRDYQEHTSCDKNTPGVCYDLNQYINMESGGENMNLNKYSDILAQNALNIQIANDNLKTNIKNMNLVLPSVLPANASNPEITDFITKYGCQIVPFKFYQRDNGLYKYETLFNDNTAGIIPMAKAIAYYQKMDMITNG